MAGHAKTISDIIFSADGKRLTTASEDGTVRFWDTTTGKEDCRRWKTDRPLLCAAASPDGKWIAAGTKEALLLWDAKTGELRHRLPMPPQEVRSAAFTPDGKLLAAVSGTTLRLWEAGTAKLVREKIASPNPIMTFAFSADGKEIFLGYGGERVVRRLETTTLNPIGTLNGHAGLVHSLVFTEDNQRLLTSTYASNELCCWDARTGKSIPCRDEDKERMERAWFAESGVGRNVLRLIQGNVTVFHSVKITITRKAAEAEEISAPWLLSRPTANDCC